MVGTIIMVQSPPRGPAAADGRCCAHAVGRLLRIGHGAATQAVPGSRQNDGAEDM